MHRCYFFYLKQNKIRTYIYSRLQNELKLIRFQGANEIDYDELYWEKWKEKEDYNSEEVELYFFTDRLDPLSLHIDSLLNIASVASEIDFSSIAEQIDLLDVENLIGFPAISLTKVSDIFEIEPKIEVKTKAQQIQKKPVRIGNEDSELAKFFKKKSLKIK